VYFSCYAARTAKAPYWQKVELLFNFFKDEKDNGIKFNSFTKMVPSAQYSFITTPAMKSRRYSHRIFATAPNSTARSNAKLAPKLSPTSSKDPCFGGAQFRRATRKEKTDGTMLKL
jgi:hypothetical protein